MRYHTFTDTQEESYKVAVLVKAAAFNTDQIFKAYAQPMNLLGLPMESMIAFTLKYDTPKKVSNAAIKEYLAELLPVLNDLKVEYLYVADANYFKVLAGQQKADIHFGYVLPCKIKGYEHMHVVLGLNHQMLIYNPSLQAKLDLSLLCLANHTTGNYTEIGTKIIHSATYPKTLTCIKAALASLHQHSVLSCDIETRSLRFHEAGLETIAFAQDKHNGIAFCVDKGNTPEDSLKIKRALKEFFTNYKGKLVYHNAGFDVQILVYELWMKTV